MNVNDFLGTHLSRLWITETFRIKNLSTFLSITAMSWPEPNEKADRSTRVQVQGQDGLSCQLVNAENCSLVRTCTREYAHHCPPRHRHHHRRRHLREKTKTETKTRTNLPEQTPLCSDRRTDMWSTDRNIQQYWRNSQKAGLTNEWNTSLDPKLTANIDPTFNCWQKSGVKRLWEPTYFNSLLSILLCSGFA